MPQNRAEPRRASHRLVARYAETDQMRRVHHSSFVIYLEEARTRMMSELGCSYALLEKRGVGLVVRELQLRYRSAAFYEDELEVRTWVGQLRGASVSLEYEILRGTDLIATGSTQLACVDLEAEPPAVRMLPPDVRAAFELALAPA